MSEPDSILIERDGPVTIVSINRPHCRNAVDGATARKLYDTFLAFDADNDSSVAVFTGTGGFFCAGADLKAVAAGDPKKKREIGGHDSIAPMGPSRLRLSKPVIAAVEGLRSPAAWNWRCGPTCAWSPRTPSSAFSAGASACR
jgi:enoyl-CoA hydratase